MWNLLEAGILAPEEDGEWIEKEDVLRGEDERNYEGDQYDMDNGVGVSVGEDNKVQDGVNQDADRRMNDDDRGRVHNDGVDEVKKNASDGVQDGGNYDDGYGRVHDD